jgi:hypothetical protein
MNAKAERYDGLSWAQARGKHVQAAKCHATVNGQVTGSYDSYHSSIINLKVGPQRYLQKVKLGCYYYSPTSTVQLLIQSFFNSGDAKTHV